MEPASLNRTAATLAIQRVERHHRLLEELVAAAPRAVQGDELATALEVSLRTVQRDVLALTQAGVPIHTKRGLHGGYALIAPRRRVAVTLDASDIAAIVASLVGVGPTTSSTARRLIAKLTSTIEAPD